MSFERSLGGTDPLRAQPVTGPADVQEERRRSTRTMAVGTLACPACDAPVLPDRPLRPAEPLTCPVCAHAGRVRDFLQLGEPTRPARVVVRLTGGRPTVR